MPLSVGTRLESYEVTAPLGAGGMGEVYRAKDAKLGREVAIKILPEAFTLDVERMARFEREARVLASLNHPGIGTLHDIQEADGKLFLALKLLPGKTVVPADWSPDGRFLIYYEAGDLFAQPFEDGDPVALADSPFEETAGHVSPDGRVLAYVSDETGRDEIWVKPFLSEGRRERVSNEGGTAPRWSPDGATLYYISPNREMVAVPMNDRDRITPGAPRVLFEVPVEYVNPDWDVLGDGGFVILAPAVCVPIGRSSGIGPRGSLAE